MNTSGISNAVACLGTFIPVTYLLSYWANVNWWLSAIAMVVFYGLCVITCIVAYALVVRFRSASSLEQIWLSPTVIGCFLLNTLLCLLVPAPILNRTDVDTVQGLFRRIDTTNSTHWLVLSKNGTLSEYRIAYQFANRILDEVERGSLIEVDTIGSEVCGVSVKEVSIVSIDEYEKDLQGLGRVASFCLLLFLVVYIVLCRSMSKGRNRSSTPFQ